MEEEKPKTLKELQQEIHPHYLRIEEIRAEAVKWRKFAIKYELGSSMIIFIEDFFNLTDEDLK